MKLPGKAVSGRGRDGRTEGQEDGKTGRQEDGKTGGREYGEEGTVVSFKFQDLGVYVGNVHYPITFTPAYHN